MAKNIVFAFQTDNGDLSIVGRNNQGDMKLGMMEGTSPSVATLPDGGWQVAFQANTGTLWIIGTKDNRGDTNLGMMKGTSPCITALPLGGWQVAFQSNEGNLWIKGTKEDLGDTKLGMMQETSPSITALPDGGFRAAFQANTGNLWIVGNDHSPGDTKLGMMAGTSPSISTNASGWQAAFQANSGNLWIVGNDDSPGDTTLGMMAGTSPSLCALYDGSWQAAFQANSGSLWTVGSAVNPGDLNLGMMAGTSPSLVAIPGGDWQIVFQSNTGNLWVVGTPDETTGDQGLAMNNASSPVLSTPWPFVINDVAAAFDRVAVNATTITIDRTGVEIPTGGHFQGIQLLPSQPQLLVLTSSSALEGFFVACDMADDWLNGRARPRVKMETSPSKGSHVGFNHAGGFQAFGHFFVAGLENSNQQTHSEIQFWDLSELPGTLVPMTPLMRPPPGPPGKNATAGAVGLTTIENGAVLVLAVASFSAQTVDFYTSAAPLGSSPFNPLFTWTPNGAHYQNINLLTQENGQVFMIGFYQDGIENNDMMDLFSVDLKLDPRDPPSKLTKLAQKHLYCTNGCTFNDGGGIFISSSQGFEVFAVRGEPAGLTINLNHFSAA